MASMRSERPKLHVDLSQLPYGEPVEVLSPFDLPVRAARANIDDEHTDVSRRPAPSRHEDARFAKTLQTNYGVGDTEEETVMTRFMYMAPSASRIVDDEFVDSHAGTLSIATKKHDDEKKKIATENKTEYGSALKRVDGEDEEVFSTDFKSAGAEPDHDEESQSIASPRPAPKIMHSVSLFSFMRSSKPSKALASSNPSSYRSGNADTEESAGPATDDTQDEVWNAEAKAKTKTILESIQTLHKAMKDASNKSLGIKKLSDRFKLSDNATLITKSVENANKEFTALNLLLGGDVSNQNLTYDQIVLINKKFKTLYSVNEFSQHVNNSKYTLAEIVKLQATQIRTGMLELIGRMDDIEKSLRPIL